MTFGISPLQGPQNPSLRSRAVCSTSLFAFPCRTPSPDTRRTSGRGSVCSPGREIARRPTAVAMPRRSPTIRWLPTLQPNACCNHIRTDHQSRSPAQGSPAKPGSTWATGCRSPESGRGGSRTPTGMRPNRRPRARWPASMFVAIRRSCTQGSPAEPGTALGYPLVRPKRATRFPYTHGHAPNQHPERDGPHRWSSPIWRSCTQCSPAEPGSALGQQLVRPKRAPGGPWRRSEHVNPRGERHRSAAAEEP
jgi:hypothetical protein